MKGDDVKAQRAIERGIAAIARQKYPEQLATLETKAENRVKNTTGMEPETAARTLAAIKLAADLSQGELHEEVDGFGVDLKYTPEEKKLMLRKSWDF